jgi:hypothetical protein
VAFPRALQSAFGGRSLSLYMCVLVFGTKRSLLASREIKKWGFIPLGLLVWWVVFGVFRNWKLDARQTTFGDKA